MQDPNEDTQWNDALRAKGILPAKKSEVEVTEEQIVKMLDDAAQKQTPEAKLGKLNLDELDELEDEEDEAVLLEYRNKRIAEMKAAAQRNRYGEVREISAEDYVGEVNKAGDGVWVVLHLYKPGIPLCSLLNQFIHQLARKFPATKFIKSVSTTCIPNYPDRNLPTVFVYYEGNLKKQFVGPHEFRGPNLKQDEFEWLLGQTGAVATTLEKDPRPVVKDVLFSKLRGGRDEDDGDDW